MIEAVTFDWGQTLAQRGSAEEPETALLGSAHALLESLRARRLRLAVVATDRLEPSATIRA